MPHESRFSIQIPTDLRDRFLDACRDSGVSSGTEIQTYLEKRIEELETIPVSRQERSETSQLCVRLPAELCSKFDKLSRDRCLTRNEQVQEFIEERVMTLERQNMANAAENSDPGELSIEQNQMD